MRPAHRLLRFFALLSVILVVGHVCALPAEAVAFHHDGAPAETSDHKHDGLHAASCDAVGARTVSLAPPVAVAAPRPEPAVRAFHPTPSAVPLHPALERPPRFLLHAALLI